MKLNELLWAENIVVQCHDYPDADAISSGWGVYTYFCSHGKKVRLIYGGREPIRKKNLTLMRDRLGIPVEYVTQLEEEPDLLVTVDCQPGQKNVTPFPAKTVAAVDHHVRPRKTPVPLYAWDIRDNYGACATIVRDLLRQEEDFDLYGNRKLVTALYYGLFMDTGMLQEIYHRADRAARDELESRCLEEELQLLRSHNLSLEEVKMTGNALSRVDYEKELRYAVAEAAPCDPNILGIIADQIIEADEVDVCVAYCVKPGGLKLSVRSCVPELPADDLARYLTGDGGGHRQKAGGFLSFEKLPDGGAEPDERARRELSERLEKYLGKRDVIRIGVTPDPSGKWDLSRDPLYAKLPVQMGYVRAAEVYPVGSRIKIRMLEGDHIREVSEDLYLMVGVDLEVYDNKEEYFKSHNDWSEEICDLTPEQLRTVEDAVSGVDVDTAPLAGHIRKCTPKRNLIRARRLEKFATVFTRNGHCFLGREGDYLAAGVERIDDLRIINGDIWTRTYAPAEE